MNCEGFNAFIQWLYKLFINHFLQEIVNLRRIRISINGFHHNNITIKKLFQGIPILQTSTCILVASTPTNVIVPYEKALFPFQKLNISKKLSNQNQISYWQIPFVAFVLWTVLINFQELAHSSTTCKYICSMMLVDTIESWTTETTNFEEKSSSFMYVLATFNFLTWLPSHISRHIHWDNFTVGHLRHKNQCYWYSIDNHVVYLLRTI